MAHNLGYRRPFLCALLVGVGWKVREDEKISHSSGKELQVGTQRRCPW